MLRSGTSRQRYSIKCGKQQLLSVFRSNFIPRVFVPLVKKPRFPPLSRVWSALLQGKSAGPFPEQRLVIEPTCQVVGKQTTLEISDSKPKITYCIFPADKHVTQSSRWCCFSAYFY